MTSDFCDRLTELYGLVKNEPRKLFNYPQDLLYLFSQTDDNRRSVIAKANSRPRTSPVAILGAGDVYGYSGHKSWRKEILCSDVRLTGNESDFEVGANTTIEASALIDYLVKENISRVFITAPEFHLLRCFMSVLFHLFNRGLEKEIDVVPVQGELLNLSVVSTHSQGALVATRAELYFHEAVRIFKYAGMGVIEDVEAAVRYLRNRQRE